MTTRASIYSLLAAAAMSLLLPGCLKPTVETLEVADTSATVAVDPRGFDPLELPRDREIVPALYPRTGDIFGKQVIIEKGAVDLAGVTRPSADDSSVIGLDTLNNQSYRVQIFTGLVYGEARQVARVAEEIFDQPVYVDYEVPNYKVRVGNWPDRASAERYQQKARGVGYTNAWVVMVGINVREVAPLYTSPDKESTSKQESTSDSAAEDDEGTGAQD
ncbi:MAG: SPOR domain-containing protein [Candidatus Zixiibacteriota bacterium]